MNNLYDVGIIIPFYGYGDEESSQEYDFSNFFFVELGCELRSEFNGIHTLMLAP